MKVRFFTFFMFLMFLSLESQLYAFGRREAEEEERTPINPEWTLVITNFDTSAMSPAWQTAGDIIQRNIAASLDNLSFRFRGDEEYAFYRDQAHARARTTAAEALARRRSERDLLVFRGDPSWRHERDLRAADEAILALEEEFARIDALAPLVERTPVLRITDANRAGTFPEPPAPGTERQFSVAQRADAFLTGNLKDFYGRIYLSMEMYTLATRSFSFHHSVLFSPDDFNEVLIDITDRIAIAASDRFPAGLAVHASPPDAMVLLDGNFIGLGETEIHILSPASAEITILADNHFPVTIPLELDAGELTEITIELNPKETSTFEVYVPDQDGSRVFLGSLFVGETPLSLDLPIADFTYISVETPGGEIGSVVHRANSIISGNAQLTVLGENHNRAEFITAMPITREEQRVGNARRNFYSAYGAFWIVLPAALLAGGIAGTYITSNNFLMANPGFGADAETRNRMANNAARANLIRNGSTVLWVSSLGISLFQVFRYINASRGAATPIAVSSPNIDFFYDEN